MLTRGKRALIVVATILAVPVSSAAAADFAETARNIIPSGQYGSVPPPPEADDQAKLYDGLTPLFDQVNKSDLNTYFKSESLRRGADCPCTTEQVNGRDVEIVRDKFHVPHIYADNHDDGVWAAGWIMQTDRGVLLQQARYNARVAAIDAPGLSAIGLVTSLQNFQPSEETEAVVAKQTQELKKAGKQGRAVLADIDTYIEGINAKIADSGSSAAPWTRNDVYALNALKGQFLGQGGGDEARRSQFLGSLQERLGGKRGKSIFDDVRQFRTGDAATTIDERFQYGKIPKKAPGSVVLDPDSYESTPAIADRKLAEKVAPQPTQASNTLMITAKKSETRNPLMVGGPQIGYFYPGLTLEMDMHAPGLNWRGATSAPYPGYLLIGRGADFANTLTSASGDIIDQYVEKLCGGSDEKYRYKGKCRSMETFDAGTLNGEPVTFLTTVHGPVVGYASRNGKKVAISSKRSSYGKDVLDQLLSRRLSNGSVRSPESFFRAANKTPQTFNSFYIDNEHVAEFTSGLLPKRPAGVDPGLPTLGTGKYEWEGFIGKNKHPHGIDPKDGLMTNWNNSVARGFGAADNEWARNGSVQRADLLDYDLKRVAGVNGKYDLAEVTSAMNAAATQDVRAIRTTPVLRQLLQGSDAPNAQAKMMLEVLKGWRKRGGSRLDLNLNGEIDDPGAAVMDVAWPKIADALMKPRLGPQLEDLADLNSRYSLPPGGQFNGWHQYFDRDIKALLGKNVRTPFENEYCGRGDLQKCQDDIWAAIADAGAELEADQGSSDPRAWHSDAERERITFAPGLLPYTMRYTNRPSGIQQVISFDGHR